MMFVLKIIFFIFLFFVSYISVLGEEGKADTVLNNFMARFETGVLDGKQVKEIKRLTKSKDEKISARANALYARYLCECENRPDEALAKIAPFVLPPDKSAEFAKKDNSKNEKTFPPASDWNLNSPECCVTASGILAYKKKYPEALAGLNLVGEKLEGFPRALAAEGVGDVLFELKQFQGAADAFRLAINVLDSFRKSSDYLNDPDKIVDIIFRRIQKKLSEAERILDCEKYGPEFVAYREARKNEFSGDFLRATVLYGRIVKDFPNIVYSEASKLYHSKCLLRLAGKTESKKAENEIIELDFRNRKTDAMLKKDSDKMSRRVAESFNALLKEDETLLSEMKTVPLGSKSAEKAASVLENFISENEFGLYRGEALLLLADYRLERELEPEKALAAYDKAVRWIEEGKKTGAEIDKFQVPEKALTVTSPPQAMHLYDVWGNLKWSEAAPGNVVNQFTCPWYFDWLELSVLSKRGLCHYILGNKEQALEDIKVIIRNSPEERKNFEAGWFNSYSRLRDEFKEGRMFATKEELAQFKGKVKTAVMVADYYYEIEDWNRAFELYTFYRELYGSKFNKKANAYFDYVLGNLYLLRKEDEKGFTLLEKFDGKLYEDTATWPRAIFALFSRYQTMKGKEEYALELLRRVHKKIPDDIMGKRAYYHQAECLFSRKRYDEAIPIFEDVMKKYPGTWLAQGASQYLDEIRKTK
jgi:tetratricopeptide (TPR) repeat protein